MSLKRVFFPNTPIGTIDNAQRMMIGVGLLEIVATEESTAFDFLNVLQSQIKELLYQNIKLHINYNKGKLSMRYLQIIDGCSLSDVTTGESGEESGSTYNYYLFTRPGGSAVIMRELSDKSEYRFYLIGNPEKSEALINSEWADRLNKVYKRTSAFKAL